MPSLILLDLRLTGMSGADFPGLQRTYYRWATIPVIVITGAPADLGEFSTRAALRKPVDWAALREVMHLHCPLSLPAARGGPPT